MRILIVDDEKDRHEALEKRDLNHRYHHAYRYKEALKELSVYSPFDLIHLDYDLLDREGTGMSVVQAILNLSPNLKPRKVNCHSLNIYRRTTMAKLLRCNGVTATACAFE